jgi:hypothetical protein
MKLVMMKKIITLRKRENLINKKITTKRVSVNSHKQMKSIYSKQESSSSKESDESVPNSERE